VRCTLSSHGLITESRGRPLPCGFRSNFENVRCIRSYAGFYFYGLLSGAQIQSDSPSSQAQTSSNKLKSRPKAGSSLKRREPDPVKGIIFPPYFPGSKQTTSLGTIAIAFQWYQPLNQISCSSLIAPLVDRGTPTLGPMTRIYAASASKTSSSHANVMLMSQAGSDVLGASKRPPCKAS
jgi:hypothetical protein